MYEYICTGAAVHGGHGYAFKRKLFDKAQFDDVLNSIPHNCKFINDDLTTLYCVLNNIKIKKI
jgi:hypothetical protein